MTDPTRDYGIRYQWPDGHTEIDGSLTRARAELQIAHHNTNGRPGVATLVTRDIGPWRVVEDTE